MKFLLQLSLLLFSWFNLSATPVFSKVASPNYAVAFHKTTNQNQESEVKIGVSNFAKSGILENEFSQKAIFLESYVLENRAREISRVVVSGAGSLVRGINKTQFFETVAEFKNPANGLLGDQAWYLWFASSGHPL